MTYIEAIREDLQPFPISEATIIRKAEKRGLKATDDVVEGRALLLIEIELLSQMMARSWLSESGISMSFDKGAAKSLLRRLCSEAGVDSSMYMEANRVTFI